jgi:hypothetical protein
MIDFFETKAFGATIVGALTTIVSLFSSTNAGAAIGLGLFIASAFLLIFEKTALSRSPPDVTSARRANPPGDLFGVTSDQRPQMRSGPTIRCTFLLLPCFAETIACSAEKFPCLTQ